MKVSGWPSAAPMGHAEIMGVLKAPEVLTLVRTPDGVWGTPACLYSSQTTAPPPAPQPQLCTDSAPVKWLC